jgi:uncharacterized protein YfdQ (DUF2303 family)
METKPRLEGIDLGEVLGVGAALALPRTVVSRSVESVPFVVVPTTFKVEALEKLLPAPSRAKGNVQFADAQSFVRYVNKHKDKAGEASAANRTSGQAGGGEQPGPDPDDVQTVIYVDPLKSKFRAVFDSHASDAPGWGEFTASYDCPISPEWKTWKEHNGRKFHQEEFAFFIEQNLLDVHEPNGAQMLEIVTTLKSVKNVAFDSGVRLSDGQVQLKYHEQNDTKAGANGQLVIPEEIKLGLPVYVGGIPYAVIAKFRYRIDGSKLIMWYDLLRPHKIEEAAVNAMIEQIEQGTDIKPYYAVL